MAVRTRVFGVEALRRKLRRIPEEGRRGVKGAIALGALQLQGEIQRRISHGSRTGRIYPPIKGRRQRPHQASAPGEYPKSDSGSLVKSIFVELDQSGLAAEVGTDIEYGQYLEFGTSKMAARPWLRPTFRALRPKIRERIQKAMQATLRKHRRR